MRNTRQTFCSNSLPSLGNRCKFLPHGQKRLWGPASVFLMSATKGVPAASGMLAKNLESLESTVSQPDHPLLAKSCECQPHYVLPYDLHPRPQKSAHIIQLHQPHMPTLSGPQKSNRVNCEKALLGSLGCWWSRSCPDNQTFGNHR